MLITDGKIVEFGQKINACALGQALAIVTSNIIGTTKVMPKNFTFCE